MKKLYRFIITFIIAFSSFSIYAQTDEYAQEMDKMLQAIDAKQVMIQTVSQGWQTMQLPLTDYSAAANDVVDTIWPGIVNIYISEFKKYYTIEDMKNINKFYETATGMKFARYSAMMSSAIQTEISRKYTATIQEILMKYIKTENR
jgi:hypothetical protein